MRFSKRTSKTFLPVEKEEAYAEGRALFHLPGHLKQVSMAFS